MFKIGDKYSEEVIFTNAMISNFARVSGDSNPIHTDKAYAIKKGFKSNIVHGMLSASVFSKILGTSFPGNGSIYVAQDLSFLMPIFADEKVSVHLEILAIKGLKYTLSTQVHKQTGLAIDGTATIIKK